MDVGLVDTNVFIHAHTSDGFSQECRAFLQGLEQGQLQARVEPLVLHELSYALPRYVKQMTRDQVAAYLLMIVSWPGVHGDKGVLVDAIERWWQTPGLAFVDAFLVARATELQCPVYTKNVRDLTGQGVTVPDPLPAAPEA